jgi:hypothetical protein
MCWEVVISMDFMANFPFEISTGFILAMHTRTFLEQAISIHTTSYYSLFVIFTPQHIE